MLWKVNSTIYGKRETIPFNSRMFFNGQEIITSVVPFLNGTTYQYILSQSSSTFSTAVGLLFVGKKNIV